MIQPTNVEMIIKALPKLKCNNRTWLSHLAYLFTDKNIKSLKHIHCLNFPSNAP